MRHLLLGVSLTVGPNYNLPMMAEPRAKVAWEALQQAQAHAGQATPVEQALIQALASRYQGAQPLDPSNEGPVLTAYAQAMQDVARRYPDDSDVQTLTAEAMMNINAWKLWSLTVRRAGNRGHPRPARGRVGQGHAASGRQPLLYSRRSKPRCTRRRPSISRALRGMMPAAGHLEHMPAHIMQRVGRYGDAAEANRSGAVADIAYFARTKPLDYYVMYTAHNYQFLAYSAVMQGRKAETLDATRKRAPWCLTTMLLWACPAPIGIWRELYAAMVRFGMWDEISRRACTKFQVKLV